VKLFDLNLLRTSGKHPDFQILTNALDTYLAGINGDKNDFFASFNQVAPLQNCILLYCGDTPIACGAFRPVDKSAVEIKRMFVLPEFRKQGVAAKVLVALEAWAREQGYTRAVLETAKSMTAAVNFYKKNNYQQIANYGPYIDIATSICFAKEL
jgi:putative acetyltransferase